jgi:transcriptional regulator of acetoin/glycerol metabolism
MQRLVVPPLRQRRDDLPALWERLCREAGRALVLSDEALSELASYPWPGNYVELQTEVNRLTRGGARRVLPDDLTPRIRSSRGVAHAPLDFSGKTLGEIEEDLVRQAMEECHGVKARVARKLGIPRSTLYHVLERYGLR